LRGPETQRHVGRAGNAFKHGLTSRSHYKAMQPAARRLADSLIRGAPDTPQVRDAAMTAAHAILHLRKVQDHFSQEMHNEFNVFSEKLAAYQPNHWKFSWRTRSPDQPMTRRNVSASEEVSHDRTWHFQARMIRHFRTLADYERKALSLMLNATRRLNYEIVEAHRVEVAASHRSCNDD
jgi:hypothetical protein